MTKTFLKGALLAAVAVVATSANAAPTTFTANAHIDKSLELTKDADLNFGVIAMQSALSSADVVVAPASGEIAVCGTNLSCSGTSNPGGFTVAGIGTQTVDLDYGTTVPTTLENTADSTKTVAFELDAPSTVDLVDGDGTFYVGGKITVAATTAPGDYKANLEVTASYQ